MDNAATDVKQAGQTLGDKSATNQPILRSIPSRLHPPTESHVIAVPVQAVPAGLQPA
jgi:hypothetical protein